MGATCSWSDDCAEPYVCLYERCRSECIDDGDCSDGHACVAVEESELRVCTVGGEGEGGDDPCPEPLVRAEGGACGNP